MICKIDIFYYTVCTNVLLKYIGCTSEKSLETITENSHIYGLFFVLL